MPKVIVTAVNSCADCSFSKATRNYTSDSFEMEFSWYCDRESTRIGIFDVKETVNIPAWCTLLEKGSE